MALAALVLASCSPMQDTSAANAAISTFHQELDSASFDAIYAGASEDMKRATSEADLTQLLAAAHRKLGDFLSGASAGWNDNVATGGHFVTINYSAKYSRGAATESFMFRIDGAQARLAGYHINSTALILN